MEFDKAQNKARQIPVMELAVVPMLVLTDKVVTQIKILCDHWPAVEWSGMLFYDVTGDTSSIEAMKFRAVYIHLMDVGSAGYTEYHSDESIIDLFEAHPELMEKKYGHCHSHCKMTPFFSGTDDDELRINSVNYNYYVSLIVNNDLNFEAKVAFPTIIEGKTFYKDGSGMLTQVNDAREDVISIATLDVKLEAPAFFVNRMSVVKDKKKKEEEEKKKKEYPSYGTGYGYNYNNCGYGYNNDYPYWKDKEKSPGEKIGSSTTTGGGTAAQTKNPADIAKLLARLLLQDRAYSGTLEEAVIKAQPIWVKRKVEEDIPHEKWIWNNIGGIIEDLFGKLNLGDAAQVLDEAADKTLSVSNGVGNWLSRILDAIDVVVCGELVKGFPHEPFIMSDKHWRAK